MPAFGEELRGFFVGNPLSIRRDLCGIPTGETVTAAVLRIKADPEDPNSDAVFFNPITTTLSSFGQITDDASGDGEGQVLFTLIGDSVAAEVTIDPTGTDNSVKYTAVTAGQAGNNITVEYVDPVAALSPLSVTVVGTVITISLETNAGSAIISTADEIITLITGDVDASALVIPTNVGLGTGVVTAIAATNLTGGNGGTSDLTPGTTFHYTIVVTLSASGDLTIETGTIISVDSDDSTPRTAASTRARAATFSSDRVNTLINEFLDVHLHDFRQLKVWDEHARRSGPDPLILQLTYRNWNNTNPEVFDAQNDRISCDKITVDPENGTVRISGDTGSEDYFVTYEFDLFPPKDLEIMLRLKLQELNVAGAAEGGHLTAFKIIDEAPTFWDGPLAVGTIAEAFKRLSTDSGLWKNYLIWQDGTKGQQIASDAAEWWWQWFIKLSLGLKQGHFIAQPTTSFELFRSIGFGFFATSGSKFRELRINRLSVF